MRRRKTHAQALKRRREDYHRPKSHADEGLALSPNCHTNVVPGVPLRQRESSGGVSRISERAWRIAVPRASRFEHIGLRERVNFGRTGRAPQR
jgi:hypothetical protein